MNKSVRVAAWLGFVVILLVGGTLLFAFGRQRSNDTSQQHPTVAKDTVKPSVEFSLDDKGRTVIAGGTLQATVTASDNKGVTKVIYEVDGVFAAVSYSPPFSIPIDVSTLGVGEHTLRATAYDAAGNASTPQTIKFTIVPDTETSAASSSSSSNSPVSSQKAPSESVASSSGSSSATSTSSASSGTSSGNSGGTTPPTTDTEAPSAPTNVQVADDGNFQVHITWAASTDNVGVTGYQILRDGSLLTTASGTSYTDTTSIPGHTYQYAVRARDAATNQSALSSTVGIGLSQALVFAGSDTPANPATNDPNGIEVGMKFQATRDGSITGVRFYKGAGNTGTHIGNLWTSTGTNLATVSFSGESSTGWQTATFATPVHVTAGTTYVASYFTPTGNYASTVHYFAVNHFASQYITGLADGDDGANALFRYGGSSAFPTGSGNAANYWVDVTFTPDTLNTHIAGTPCPAWPALPDATCTGVPSGTTLKSHTGDITIEADNVVVDGYDIHGSLTIQANNVIIRNTHVRGLIVANATLQTGLLVENAEIGDSVYQTGVTPPIGDGNYTMRNTHVHGWQDGARTAEGTVVIKDSISDDLYFTPGEHPDGYQQFEIGGVAHVTLEHNILSGCAGNTNDKGNSAIFWSDSPGAGSTLDALHNSFRCGQYSVRVNDAGLGSGVTVNIHDNQIVKNSYGIGPYECQASVVYNGSEGLQWSNNVYDDGSAVAFTGCP